MNTNNKEQTVTVIAAMTNNRVIGFKNDLPWKHLKDDMLHFKNTTTNHIVIMGFNTWESFGKRPLPNRINIVLTTKNINNHVLTNEKYDDKVYENTYFVNSIDDAMLVCNMYNVRYREENDVKIQRDIFIIGGGKIYKSFLESNLVDKMLLTMVKNVFFINRNQINDIIFFPDFDTNKFNETVLKTHEADERNEFDFSIVEYVAKLPKMY